MKDVDISYSDKLFNGSLMKENVFRQRAGPDVDVAWESLGVDCEEFQHNIRVLMLILPEDRAALVPAELAAKSGLSPDQVQVSDEYGGGYFGNLEALHHLHCLVRFFQTSWTKFADIEG